MDGDPDRDLGAAAHTDASGDINKSVIALCIELARIDEVIGIFADEGSALVGSKV